MANITLDAGLLYNVGNLLVYEGRGVTVGADTLLIWFTIPNNPLRPTRYRVVTAGVYNGSTGAVSAYASIYDPRAVAVHEVWRESVAAAGTGQLDFSGQLYFYPEQMIRVVIPLAEAVKTGFAFLHLAQEEDTQEEMK